MRYLRHEFVRIFGQKSFIGCCILLLLVNIGVLWIAYDTGTIDATEYKQLRQKMLSDEDCIANLYEENMESATYQRLYDEYQSCKTYPAYLQNVLKDAEGNQQISIFRTAFSINNMNQTREDYGKLRTISPVFVGGYGVETGMSFLGSNLIVFLFVLILLNDLIIRDKKKGLLSLYRTTWRGGFRLLVNKGLVAICSTAIFVVGIYVGNLLLSLAVFGKVDMQAPVQSLLAYVDYGFPMEIWQLVTANIVYKIVFFSVIVSILLLLSVFASNEIVFYTGAVLLALIEWLLYRLGERSASVLLIRTNLFQILNPEVFFRYYNYNFFQRPILSMPVDLLVGILVLAGMLLVAGAVFRKKDTEYAELRLPRFLQMRIGTTRKTLWGLERYKLWWGYRFLMAFAVLVVVQGYTYWNYETAWPADKVYYRNYMKRIQGDITQEKIDYIQGEVNRMEALHKAYGELNDQYEAGTIDKKYFEKESERISKELNAEDSRYHMDALLNLSWNARTLKKQKHLRILLILLGCILLIYVPEYVVLASQIGFDGGGYAVQCIPVLGTVSLQISIHTYFVFVYAIRVLTMGMVVVVTAGIGRRMKNGNACIMIATFLFVIPLLLHLLGVSGMDKISANAFLSGNMLLRS